MRASVKGENVVSMQNNWKARSNALASAGKEIDEHVGNTVYILSLDSSKFLMQMDTNTSDDASKTPYHFTQSRYWDGTRLAWRDIVARKARVPIRED